MAMGQAAKTGFGGVQWLFFMFANTVVIPISIAAAFHQSATELASSLQLSFLGTGLACLLQAFLGHRLSLMEGQSGVWWGVILSLAASSQASGISLAETGGALLLGMMAAGAGVAIAGALGAGRLLQRLFNGVSAAVYLLLLAVQLCTIFLRGMLGMTEGGAIHPAEAGLAAAVTVFTGILAVASRGALGRFAIMIGMAVGWLSYVLLFGSSGGAMATGWSVPNLFPWGQPVFRVGIFLTVLIAALVNTTNTLAALRGAEPIYERVTTDSQLRRSLTVTGLLGIGCGLLGLVPYAPYASSLGFLRATRMAERAPFILGALLFVLLGSVPKLAGLFATLPASVGDAVLLVAYLQLFGSALQPIQGMRFGTRTIYRLAAPVLIGIGLLALPASAYATLPAGIRPLLGSGMLVGVLLSMVLENAVPWDRLKDEV